MDPSTKHYALCELKRAPAIPFAGEAHMYHSWLNSLKHRMQQINMNPLDEIDVLEAHTVGSPRDVVSTFKIAYNSNPNLALRVIYNKLNERFGSDVEIASQLKRKLQSFPDIKGHESDPAVASQIRKLSDLCIVIAAQMEDAPDLLTFNFPSSQNLVRNKLPKFINSRWGQKKFDYYEQNRSHPHFECLCDFLERTADQLCSDLLPSRESVCKETGLPIRKSDYVFRTLQTGEVQKCVVSSSCQLHQTNSHNLVQCYEFKNLSHKMKQLLVKNYELCYRCLGKHKIADCNEDLKCEICHQSTHITVMHIKPRSNSYHNYNGNKRGNSSPEKDRQTDEEGTSLCTSVCNGQMAGKSCGKTIPVDIISNQEPKKVFRTYVIVDEQSTNSFATSALLNFMGIKSPVQDYWIKTMSSLQTQCTGRTAEGLFIRGVTQSEVFPLPKLYENNVIPNTKSDVATLDMIEKHPSLSMYAPMFPPFDSVIQVDMLIGRDAGNLLASRMINDCSFFVHETPLGYAVIGNVCPRIQSDHSAKKFSVLNTQLEHEHCSAKVSFGNANIFKLYRDDDMPGQSADDRRFVDLIGNNTIINNSGHIEMPLPFRLNRVNLPNNKNAVYHRQRNTLSRLESNESKLSSCIEFMQKFVDAEQVEKVPQNEISLKQGNRWYLPIFPVQHPKKLTTRLVFDSAASYAGISLNSVLLQGPDQNNKLRGVLYRFREDTICFVADIQSMFHSFYVSADQRDYMRFFWYKDNIPKNDLVEFRAKVHIFGNCSSPAIATMGLRRAADSIKETNEDEEDYILQKAKSYILHNFYVDDGLGCASNTDEAIRILKSTRNALQKFNIRLHKIVSNDERVINFFPESERGKACIELPLDDSLTHQTLGVSWNIVKDAFVFNVKVPERCFSKRGIVSIINSIYDPIGISSPVVLEGRLIQRLVLPRKVDTNKQFLTYGWDDVLPDVYLERWNKWKESLRELSSLTLPRCIKPSSFGTCLIQTLHIFTDASEHAISHIVYLRSVNAEEKVQVSFVYGESKVTPKSANTIPRLELCAAVNAAQSAFKLILEMSNKPHAVYYYTDSKVVLGYIKNDSKSFTKYVTRRIEMIERVSEPSQWNYIDTNENPADIGTRPISAVKLVNTCWLRGPEFLQRSKLLHEPIEIVNKHELPERVTVLNAFCTTKTDGILQSILVRMNRWNKIVKIVARVMSMIRCYVDNFRMSRGIQLAVRNPVASSDHAVQFIIRQVQQECFK